MSEPQHLVRNSKFLARATVLLLVIIAIGAAYYLPRIASVQNAINETEHQGTLTACRSIASSKLSDANGAVSNAQAKVTDLTNKGLVASYHMDEATIAAVADQSDLARGSLEDATAKQMVQQKVYSDAIALSYNNPEQFLAQCSTDR